MKKTYVFGLTTALILVLIVNGSFGDPQTTSSASQEPPEYGPAKGTLVIVGGGPTNNTGIIEKFIQLAGGPDSNFIIVPTAGGNKKAEGKNQGHQGEEGVDGW